MAAGDPDAASPGILLGTAGHVDHGKSALVFALTGTDPDRLPEEKRRGITLELGFAQLTLDDGTRLGVVDVPGHERFVKAMAAGAGGIDVVLLVIALDEGVMPQTREHLDLCRLLGVRAGVVVLTKVDLLQGLGQEWLGLVQQDVAALVQGTFLEGAPVVQVSARTGQGLPALRTALASCVTALPPRPQEGPAFLPIDRVFTVKGFGTVVTGTLRSGTLLPTDAVALVPGGPQALRMRGLQTHGRASSKAVAGQRVAVNLPQVVPDALHRGQVLVREGEVPQSARLDVEVMLLPSVAAPLGRRRRLLLHIGTAQVEAELVLLDVATLEPGATALAQLKLRAPIAALPEQRFILRGSRAVPGRGTTLAGGRVLSLTPPKRRMGTGTVLAPLLEANTELRLLWLVQEAGARGMTADALPGRVGLSMKALSRLLDRVTARGEVVLVDRESRLYASPQALERLGARAVEAVSRFHLKQPLAPGLSREALRQSLSHGLSPKMLARSLQRPVAQGELELAQDFIRQPGRGRTLSVDEQGLRARAEQLLSEAGLAPPRLPELAHALLTPEEALRRLLTVAVAEGALVKVSEVLYFARAALLGLQVKLVARLEAEGEISTQDFKDLVGQSRKYVIPLSEYFDREKVTLRVGERRLLRRA